MQFKLTSAIMAVFAATALAAPLEARAEVAYTKGDDVSDPPQLSVAYGRYTDDVKPVKEVDAVVAYGRHTDDVQPVKRAEVAYGRHTDDVEPVKINGLPEVKYFPGHKARHVSDSHLSARQVEVEIRAC
ncbi:hypothetical protein QBC37DRAFT_406585 [Rhypophila decipiens]|uniref:Uncharacterized protein n=1 Tax=Rhypophila decipiens TaxID=261697 RepID=A0AAN6XUM8_9PEZI|nr:hypothetical protein QBC37DRAFT_406585 [Rhypophila decipiens]